MNFCPFTHRIEDTGEVEGGGVFCVSKKTKQKISFP
jgi:hypothetical protein